MSEENIHHLNGMSGLLNGAAPAAPEAASAPDNTLKPLAERLAPQRRGEKKRDLDIRIVTPPGGGFVVLDRRGYPLNAYSNWIDLMAALKDTFADLPGEEEFAAGEEDVRAMMGAPKRGLRAIWG